MAISLINTKVLVVDDDPDTCDVIRRALEKSGASVVVANGVDAAVWAFRRSPADAVVTDIRLGGSDGYSLLEAIRKCNAEYKGVTTVIAMTGYASPEDEEKAITAGFDAYLCKPCDPHDLVVRISKALSEPLDLAA